MRCPVAECGEEVLLVIPISNFRYPPSTGISVEALQWHVECRRGHVLARRGVEEDPELFSWDDVQ